MEGLQSSRMKGLNISLRDLQENDMVYQVDSFCNTNCLGKRSHTYPSYLQEMYQRNMARPHTTGAWMSVIELEALFKRKKIPGIVAFRVYVLESPLGLNLRSNNPATPPTNDSLQH